MREAPRYETGPEAAAATASASEPDHCTPSDKESVMPSMENRQPSVNLDRLVREPITELDFTRGLHTTANANAQTCPSWCDDPGHESELNPADRNCWSEDRGVALNANEWFAGRPVIIESGAYRAVGSPDPVVLVGVKGGRDDAAVSLTADEARRLAANLLHFANLIEEG